MSDVRVGLIGAGFSAHIHARAYRRIHDATLVGVAALPLAQAQNLAREYDIPHAYGDAHELIARNDINVVDLCVPNDLHEPLTLAAVAAGKHVICEKPLTGYFGGQGAAEPVGATPKMLMLREAVASAERMVCAAQEHGVQLMYAENWLYAPAIVKAARLAEVSGGAILEIRGQECHSGSHAGYAKWWRSAGGGAILRLGAHPIGAALWLKAQEGLRRDGAPIGVESVWAEVGDLTRTAAFRAEREHHLVADWQDVENWGTILLNFSDGAKAVIHASDIVLGGMEDTFQVILSNGRVNCNMTHHNMVQAFAPTPEVFGDEYLMEKLSTKAGWSYPSVDEEYLLGYPQEIADFVECAALGRTPRSTGRLGLEVVKVIYAAYRSAEEGRRIAI